MTVHNEMADKYLESIYRYVRNGIRERVVGLRSGVIDELEDIYIMLDVHYMRKMRQRATFLYAEIKMNM